MKLRESRHGHIHVLHLEGDIDMHHSTALQDLLSAKLARSCPALVLDLSGVDFIDSRGMAVLITYLRDATSFGGEFCVAGLTTHVREVFKIVRLDRALPVFRDVAEAEKALLNGSVPASPEPLFGNARQHPATAED